MNDDVWYVDVKYSESGVTEHRIGPYDSESLAERAERGININLNHDQFYTMIVEPEGYDEPTTEEL